MVWGVKRKNEVVTISCRIRDAYTNGTVLQDNEPIIVGPGSFEILSMSWNKQHI